MDIIGYFCGYLENDTLSVIVRLFKYRKTYEQVSS
jgi:hypothetical protein